MVTVVEGDVRDRQAVARVMAGIDLVYHQAAIRITRCAEEPRVALEVLADGTFNVVEAAADEGVRRVVAASSASVYGQAEVLPTAESHHPWDNETLYGAAKQFNEGVLRAFRQTHGLNYIALRYFNVYGPRMDIHGVYTEVLVRWMERIEAGEPPLILGDGSQTMDFVHVADVARANILAGTTPCEGEVFNVGRGVSTSLAELAATLTRVMGAEQLTPVHGPERATNAVHSRRADISKAREQLGFVAEVDLEAGLADLVAWWRASRVRRTWCSTSEPRRSRWSADDHPGDAALAGPRGDRGRHRRARVRLDRPGRQGARVRGGAGGARCRPPKASPSRTPPPVCTCRCTCWACRPGDEVIVPSLSFIATANSVLQTGARPVFADVDESTQNLTAKTIEERLSSPHRGGHGGRPGRRPG